MHLHLVLLTFLALQDAPVALASYSVGPYCQNAFLGSGVSGTSVFSSLPPLSQIVSLSTDVCLQAPFGGNCFEFCTSCCSDPSNAAYWGGDSACVTGCRNECSESVVIRL